HRVPREGRSMGARRPGPQRLPADEGADRHAGSDALGNRDEVGLDAGVLDRPPAPGPAHARLDLVGDEDDPVLIAQLAQAAQEAGRGGEVAALALDRLDDDGGNVLRGDLAGEDRLAQMLELRGAVPAGGLAPGTHAREWRVMDHRQQWPEAGPLLDLRVGQGERAQRSAVEAALERDDPRPMRVIAGEL